jgi:hypothetical protein
MIGECQGVAHIVRKKLKGTRCERAVPAEKPPRRPRTRTVQRQSALAAAKHRSRMSLASAFLQDQTGNLTYIGFRYMCLG